MIKVLVCTCAEKIPDIASAWIMRVTKYEASHAFIVYKGEIFEAVPPVTRRVPFAPLLVDHRIIDQVEIILPVTEEQFYAWWETVKDKPYSTFQWGGFVVPEWLHWMFKNGRNGAVCTELVIWLFEDLLGIKIKKKEFQNPQWIALLAKKIAAQQESLRY